MPTSNGIHIALTNRGKAYHEHHIPTQSAHYDDESTTTRAIIQRRSPANKEESCRLQLQLDPKYKMFSATALHIRVVVARQRDLIVYDEVLVKADIKKAMTEPTTKVQRKWYSDEQNAKFGPWVMEKPVTLPEDEMNDGRGLAVAWERGWEAEVGFVVIFVERGKAEKAWSGRSIRKCGIMGLRPQREDSVGGGWRKLAHGPNMEATVFGFQVKGSGDELRKSLKKMKVTEVVDLDGVDAEAAKKAARPAAKIAEKPKGATKLSGAGREISKPGSGTLAGCAQDCDDEEGPPQKPASVQPSAQVTKAAPVVTQPAVTTKTVQQKTPLLDQVLQAGRADQAAAAEGKATNNPWETGGLGLTVKASPRKPVVIELGIDSSSDDGSISDSISKSPMRGLLPNPWGASKRDAAKVLARNEDQPLKQLVSSMVSGTAISIQSSKPAVKDAIRETSFDGEGKDMAVRPNAVVTVGSALAAGKHESTAPAEEAGAVATTKTSPGLSGIDAARTAKSGVQFPVGSLSTRNRLSVKFLDTPPFDYKTGKSKITTPAKPASTPQVQQQPAKVTEMSTTVPAQPPKPAAKELTTTTALSKELAKVAKPKQKAEASVPTPDTNTLKRKAAVMEEAADLEDELNDEMAEIELEKRAIEVKRRLRELARRKRELGMQNIALADKTAKMLHNDFIRVELFHDGTRYVEHEYISDPPEDAYRLKNPRSETRH
ncbi:hypothetical protein LTR15_000171 [Elasticomyces elasticus]|nr:hypothetical protein LTR15_000171 [Elasticomyces elasticus]